MKALRSRIFIILLFPIFVWGCSDSSEGPISRELPAIDLLDESYGSDPRQSLNVYLPAGRSSEDTPLLIYIHGGAWIDGDKGEFDAFRGLAEIHFPDYAYISVGYRLFDLATRANPFPTQENDILDALNYIESQLEEWNVSDHAILAGASAGGHLALLQGYKHTQDLDVKSIIAFFPPTDLAALHSFNFITQLGLESLLGGSPTQNPSAYAESSPTNYIDTESIPTIFFHGTADDVVPISQSEILADLLATNGVDHEFVIIQGQGHGFSATTYAEAFAQAAQFTATYFP
ncbi:prolyl oligopeptidase family serine peptidase [Algoriphagus namhaensis]